MSKGERWGHIPSYTYATGVSRHRTMYGAVARMRQLGRTKKHIKAKCEVWHISNRIANQSKEMCA